MGGSSKKQTAGYRYYAGEHLILHRGVADKITEIRVDERTAWLPNGAITTYSQEIFGNTYTKETAGYSGEGVDGETISIRQVSLFGGEGREGGISGDIDLCFGGPSQTKNTYLQSLLGAVIPAFRGLTALVLKQVYMGTNYYLKPWAVRSQRIHLRGAEGDAQWYDEKAEIGHSNVLTVVDGDPVEYIGNYAITGTVTYGDETSFQTSELVSESFVAGEYVVQITFRNYDYDGNFLNSSTLSHSIPTYGVTQSTDFFSYAFVYGKASKFIVCNNVYNVARVYPSTTNSPISGLVGDIFSATYTPGYYWLAAGSRGFRIDEVDVASVESLTGFGFSPQLFNVYHDSVTGRTFIAGRDSAVIDYRITEFQNGDVTDVVWTQIIASGSGNFNASQTRAYFHNDYLFVGLTSALRVYTIDEDGVTLLASESRIDASENIQQVRTNYAFNGDELYKLIGEQVLVYLEHANMNPAHIIREDFTDAKADGGMGLQDSDIDDDSFMAAADTLYDEGMGISMLWDNPSDHDAFRQEIERHINAVTRIDHTTGKIQLKLIREDYDIESLPVLGSDIVQSVEDFNQPSFSDLVNTVTVSYTDAASGDTKTLTVSDQTLVQQQGGTNTSKLDYPGFTNAEIASRVATRDLLALTKPLKSCTINCTRAAATLNLGDPFILDMPDDGFDAVVMRVVSMRLADSKSHGVRIECTQDVFSLPDNAVITGGDDQFENPNDVTAVAADPRLVIEAPYYELVQEFGDVQADATLTDDPALGRLFVTAKAPSLSVNADLIVDAGGGYLPSESVTIDYCPTATLAADVSYLDTAWTIEAGADLGDVVLGNWAIIDDEMVRVDAFDTDAGTLTIGRAVLDTVPAEHAAGTTIFFPDAFGESDGVDYSDGETVGVKILPAYSNTALDEADAPEDSLEFNARAYRPYPPALVQIGGEYFPDTVTSSDDLVFTWVGRDRTQQTSGTLYDFEDGNIGPEAGVTYIGYVTDNDADTLLEYDVVTSPWSPSIAGDYTLRVELYSLRDGYQSFYPVTMIFDYADNARLTESADARVTESDELRVFGE